MLKLFLIAIAAVLIAITAMSALLIAGCGFVWPSVIGGLADENDTARTSTAVTTEPPTLTNAELTLITHVLTHGRAVAVPTENSTGS
ncbi:hypothetical protein [Nocardia sp. IFM 10818]